MRLFAMSLLLAAPAFAQDGRPSYVDRLRAADANADGKLSREEWHAGGRPDAAFDRIDTNKDGFVTIEEALEARSRQQPGMPPPQ